MSLFFYFLALIFAFSGITYEYVLAYFITGLAGGGYSILFLTFSIFAAFLGCGAILFNFIPAKLKTLGLLSGLQVLLGLLTLTIPQVFQELNLIYLQGDSNYYSVIFLALLPAAVMGCATGFELPFLYSISNSKISTILAWDYLGMFLGIILFPFILSRHLPYHVITQTLGIIAILIGFFIFVISRAKRFSELSNGLGLQKNLQKEKPKIPLAVGLSVAFLLSFCSFSYQGLVGKVILSILGDNYIVQSYAIGFFIIGMALGAFLIDTSKRMQGPSSSLLVKIETYVCITAALTPVCLYFMGGSIFILEGTQFKISEQGFLIVFSILFSVFSLIIGALTGMELPLILRWMGIDNDSKDSYWVIASNYIAAVFSGVLISFILPQYLGHSLSFLPIIFINVLAIFIVLSQQHDFSSKQKALPLIFVIGAVTFNTKLINKSRQFFLDTYYAAFSMPELSIKSLESTLTAIEKLGRTTRIESFFQNIDIRTTEEHTIEAREHEFALYLNKQPQFSSLTYQNYHQSMSFAGLSFISKMPDHILILGGGDGLLAAELLNKFPKSKIKLIELDPTMIELASRNNRFLELNEHALHNPLVQVQVADAYNYVRKTQDRYDLVFVDFPYPTSVDLARLYSFEFYQGLHRILNDTGVAIIDAPIIINYDGSKKNGAAPIVSNILSTIYYAGFKKPFCFGPFDPFVAIAKDNRELNFKDDVVRNASNPVFLNLKSISQILGEIKYDESLVHKVLEPTILEL